VAQKPNLTLLTNVPCILSFPFANDPGGVEPSWSGPSKQDPDKMRHSWTVNVETGQPQYPAGEFALWGSDSLKALIDAAYVGKDTYLQLAHLQVGQVHSWEAHVWNPQANEGKGSWDKVPDPGPSPAPGQQGAASSPPAGRPTPPAAGAPPARTPAAPPPTGRAPAGSPGAGSPGAGPVADSAGHTAWDLQYVGTCFLIMARKAFEEAHVEADPTAVQDYASTLMIQASKLQLAMPWDTSPPEEAPVAPEAPERQPGEEGDEDDLLPF
jgi:hypothetical protein